MRKKKRICQHEVTVLRGMILRAELNTVRGLCKRIVYFLNQQTRCKKCL